MPDSNFLSDLASKITNAIPSSVKDLQKDLEKNIHAILQSAFNKLDLITREEFDTQKGVLLRTRTKLEAVEKRLADLEALAANYKPKTKTD